MNRQIMIFYFKYECCWLLSDIKYFSYGVFFLRIIFPSINTYYHTTFMPNIARHIMKYICFDRYEPSSDHTIYWRCSSCQALECMLKLTIMWNTWSFLLVIRLLWLIQSLFCHSLFWPHSSELKYIFWLRNQGDTNLNLQHIHEMWWMDGLTAIHIEKRCVVWHVCQHTWLLQPHWL